MKCESKEHASFKERMTITIWKSPTLMRKFQASHVNRSTYSLSGLYL